MVDPAPYVHGPINGNSRRGSRSDGPSATQISEYREAMRTVFASSGKNLLTIPRYPGPYVSAIFSRRRSIQSIRLSAQFRQHQSHDGVYN